MSSPFIKKLSKTYMSGHVCSDFLRQLRSVSNDTNLTSSTLRPNAHNNDIKPNNTNSKGKCSLKFKRNFKLRRDLIYLKENPCLKGGEGEWMIEPPWPVMDTGAEGSVTNESCR